MAAVMSWREEYFWRSPRSRLIWSAEKPNSSSATSDSARNGSTPTILHMASAWLTSDGMAGFLNFATTSPWAASSVA